MGFDGKTLIHPNQIGPATPRSRRATKKSRRRARSSPPSNCPRTTSKGVVALDGRMVERLHADMARRTVAIADAIAERDGVMGARSSSSAPGRRATRSRHRCAARNLTDRSSSWARSRCCRISGRRCPRATSRARRKRARCCCGRRISTPPTISRCGSTAASTPSIARCAWSCSRMARASPMTASCWRPARRVRKLPVPGAELAGVAYVRTLADAVALKPQVEGGEECRGGRRRFHRP